MSLGVLRRPAFLVALCVLGSAALGMSAGIKYFKLYLRKEKIYAEGGRQASAIPSESPSWIRLGADYRMAPEIEEVLGTTNYVSRVYEQKVPAKGQQPVRLDFHAAYYTGMIDTVPHVPDRCMVGAGLQLESVIGDIALPVDTSRWLEDDTPGVHGRGKVYRAKTQYNNPDATNPNPRYTDLEGTYVRLPRDADKVKLRVMKFSGEGAHPIYAGYFFIANGGLVSRAEEVRLLAFNLRDTYSYYMKVEFKSQNVESPEELAKYAAAFLDEYFPEIMRCTPDWVKVESGEYPPDNPLKAPGASSAVDKKIK
ncbi:MAG: hypothetical protein JSR77_03475 [Planctomycetes bacterium]|nr:hypothetical protein [Planctomycetota bacterium]